MPSFSYYYTHVFIKLSQGRPLKKSKQKYCIDEYHSIKELTRLEKHPTLRSSSQTYDLTPYGFSSWRPTKYTSQYFCFASLHILLYSSYYLEFACLEYHDRYFLLLPWQQESDTVQYVIRIMHYFHLTHDLFFLVIIYIILSLEAVQTLRQPNNIHKE